MACNFFMSQLAKWLRTCRFSEPTVRLSEAPNQWENTDNRDFPTFLRTCIFFLLTLSLLWSSLFFFSSLTLPTSAFSICPYCRKCDFSIPFHCVYIYIYTYPFLYSYPLKVYLVICLKIYTLTHLYTFLMHLYVIFFYTYIPMYFYFYICIYSHIYIVF